MNEYIVSELEKLNIIISTNPLDAESYYKRGNIRKEVKDFVGAINDYSKAIEINQHNILAYKSRGITNLELKFYNNATNQIDSKSYSKRGNIRNVVKEFVWSINNYSKVFEINQNNILAFRLRGRTKLDLKDYNGGIEDFKSAIKIGPNNSWSYFDCGTAYKYAKKYEFAIINYSKVIELEQGSYPTKSSAMKNAIINIKLLGDIVEYSKMIELKQNNISEYLNLRGNAYDNLTDYEDAIEDYSKAIEINPNNSSYYYSRGSSKIKLKDYKGGINDYLIAVEVNSNDENIINILKVAKELFELKNYEISIVLYEIYFTYYSITNENEAKGYLLCKLKKNDNNFEFGPSNNKFNELIKLQNGLFKKEEDNQWAQFGNKKQSLLTIEEKNIKNLIEYKKNHIIGFGKYAGEKLYDVIKKDPTDVLSCIINLTHFSISNYLLINNLFANENNYLQAVEINLVKSELIKIRKNIEEDEMRERQIAACENEKYQSDLNRNNNDWMDGDSSNYWNID